MPSILLRDIRDCNVFCLMETLTNPLQFAYWPNKSIHALSQVLHSSLSSCRKGGLLFINYSSPFNTIVPSRLDGKLIELGLNTPLCPWILDF